MIRVGFLACLIAVTAGLALADDSPSDRASLGEWPMETLRTQDGRTYRGLLQAENQREVEFVEVVRPPGKDMYLVVRPIPAGAVADVQRLEAEERRKLIERIEQFKHRTRIEAGRMENVRLKKSEEGAAASYIYNGPWFRLASTSDDETTRRAVVRIEQIFRAYRHALPPRTEPRRRLEVMLYGSMEQYREYLLQNRLEIDHPAFFSAEANVIVAGADLSHYAERLKQIRAENERIEQQYRDLNREFPRQQRELAERLRERGFTDDQVREELRVRGKAWDDRFQVMLRKISEVNRRNDARFDDVSQQLFTRLRHEAFHAYLENYLFPQSRYDFPRWLNEGLAQVFESGRLDGETLRIDAPDRDLLRRLQADLTGGYRLPLAELLTSADEEFLITHSRADAADRRYLYSWGLAWHLLFNRNLLGGEKLDKYVQTDATQSPLRRFEGLVGQKLPDFERAWIEAMLNLSPASSAAPR
ncbi:MAG: DUF1570 domain-containing protein [Planctomycetes bacterium]|nr:DUF1570 domain-containing protein [Planctomycetota bacterium]